MNGLVIINAYPNGEKFLRQGERIASELRALGMSVNMLKRDELLAGLNGLGEVASDAILGVDFAVYLDKDKYLGRLLEKANIRLFNRAEAIELCDDKFSTYLALSGKGLPLAESIPAPLCYTPNAIPDEKFLQSVAERLGFPLVVKKSYGSFGQGVQLVHGMPKLRALAKEFLYTPHFYQRYIHESCGRDIRVIVIGGKAFAAMERVARTGEFRSNVELGGEGRSIEPLPEYLAVAERAAQALGLDYCGVDLLETAEGPVLCEVNSNAFFEGLERVTNKNVAEAYAKYIYFEMNKKQEK